jgi:hypothetical protein
MFEPGLQLRNRCLRLHWGRRECAQQSSGKAPGKQKRISSRDPLGHGVGKFQFILKDDIPQAAQEREL